MWLFSIDLFKCSSYTVCSFRSCKRCNPPQLLSVYYPLLNPTLVFEDQPQRFCKDRALNPDGAPLEVI